MGLFQDSLKKWFYTNNSSAASSDARVPLLNANGTPKGSDTMANLASVLGGLRPGSDWGDKDINNAPDNSVNSAAPIRTGSANYPTGEARGFTITRHIGGNKWQEFYGLGGDSSRQIISHWYRNYVSETWYPWMMVPLADSTTGLVTMLGGIREMLSDNKSYISVLAEQVFNNTSCSTIQDTASTTVTISSRYFGGGTGGRCSILIIGQNTGTPSIFACGRKTVTGTIYDGSHIHQSNLSFNSDGSLTVTKSVGLSLYFRVIVMEW